MEGDKTGSTVPNSQVNKSSKTMKEKLLNAAPYNIFFTKIPEAKETLDQENTISFQDLLSPSLGELIASLQINFIVDIVWLMEHYQAQGVDKKPLTVLYGYEFEDINENMQLFPQVTHHFVEMKAGMGIHHSKVGLYSYRDDSLRVVVSSANLYNEDWNIYNQGMWVSPNCPRLPADKNNNEGSGPTGFKPQLLRYLQSYRLPCLQQWIDLVKKTDFSDIKVFFVSSIPGKHKDSDGSHLLKVADLLSRYCTLESNWDIVAQASALGSFGKNPANWLKNSFLRTLAAHKQGHQSSLEANLSIIYPTRDNVMSSYFGEQGGGCLPYEKAVHEKQKWLNKFLYQWKADCTFRTQVMPHIKTYTRVSPCSTKLAWFLLTSANASKSAWGIKIQKGSTVLVRSYEAGVLFLPSFFDDEYFAIKEDSLREGKKLFPFIYDLPLTPYESSDYPWCN